MKRRGLLEEYDPKTIADVDGWLETGFAPGPLIERLMTRLGELEVVKVRLCQLVRLFRDAHEAGISTPQADHATVALIRELKDISDKMYDEEPTQET